MYRKLALLICAALSLSTASAQTESSKQKELFHNYSKLLSPEKVYLHTDKDVYFATDTIWFSGYVENASYASEFDESNYIYVELIGKQVQRDERSLTNYSKYESNVIVRKKIRRTKNIFEGYIAVPEMQSTGKVIIRAYTYWMLNRPVEYMFYKELDITNPMKDKLVQSMHDNGVKDKKEFLRLGEIPFNEKEKLERENSSDGERYDVQFLPESGNCVEGNFSVLFVKSIDVTGSGAAVFGEILNLQGDVVAAYSTDSLGFGKVVVPDFPNEGLLATVKDSMGYEGKPVRFATALKEGVTINAGFSITGIEEFGNNDLIKLSIKASSACLQKELRLFIHNGSEIYYSRHLAKNAENVAIKLCSLIPGIHIVSVLDAHGNIYAERPFVILPPAQKYLSVTADKQRYRNRELVNVQIQIPSHMLDGTSNFSVAVTDIGITDNVEKTTIKSYMLLKSELHGYIENLDWYFNDSIPLSIRMHRADMLMQTQGWRYYDISEIVRSKTQMPYFGREYTQTLFGKVVNPMGLTKKSTVSFLAPSIGFKAMGQIDSGYFVLKDVSFPEDTRFIVSAVGKNGRSQKHTPILQNDYFAPIFEYPVKNNKIKYTDEYKKIVETIYYNNDDVEHSMEFELNPVIVTSQTIVPKNSPSPLPDYPIRREWFRDTLDMKSYATNYDVAAYVEATYTGVRQFLGGPSDEIELPTYLKMAHRAPEEFKVKEDEVPSGSLIGPYVSAASVFSDGVYMSKGKTKRTAVVLVYLNGSFIYPEEAVNNVLTLPLSDVESIIYVSGVNAAPFQPAFSSGDLCPFPVLMVRTKPYVRSDAIPYNVACDYPLGWQKPAKFYTPKYDSPDKKKSSVEDKRITLYWNPSVQFDSNGVGYISFYTSDSDSNYRIEVEGRSSSRQYHYVEKIIERKVESEPASRRK